jgi:hypothetical protein
MEKEAVKSDVKGLITLEGGVKSQENMRKKPVISIVEILKIVSLLQKFIFEK